MSENGEMKADVFTWFVLSDTKSKNDEFSVL